MKYAGKWYEISRYEQPYTFGCVCVEATYTIHKSGDVGVKNCCSRNGSPNCLLATALVSYPDQNPLEGRLNVSFFGGKLNIYSISRRFRWFTLILQLKNLQITGLWKLITSILLSFISASLFWWINQKNHFGYYLEQKHCPLMYLLLSKNQLTNTSFEPTQFLSLLIQMKGKRYNFNVLNNQFLIASNFPGALKWNERIITLLKYMKFQN